MKITLTPSPSRFIGNGEFILDHNEVVYAAVDRTSLVVIFKGNPTPLRLDCPSADVAAGALRAIKEAK